MQIVGYILIIAVVVALMTFMFTSAYNKLLRNKNHANETWLNIVKEINLRYNLYTQYSEAVKTTIDAATINTFNTSIASYRNKVSIDDIINNYYETDNICKAILGVISTPEWLQVFNDSFNRIEALRKDYNDTILKINNLVKMFPTSLVAKMAGFGAWPFFRGI